MKSSAMFGAIVLGLTTSLVMAQSTSSESSTYSSSSRTVPGESTSSATRTEQQVDQYGNVIKKSVTNSKRNPATGAESSSSSTTRSSPDGTQSTIEQTRSSDGVEGHGSVTEKRTTTVTP